MGNVLTLVRRTEAAKPKTACGPHYFCTKCQGETFRVYQSGAVHCERCGCKMRNLTAHAEKDSA